jgi:hypothetical protein
MKAIPFAYAIATSAIALVCGAAGAAAQQVTGVLGSPEATTTLTANSCRHSIRPLASLRVDAVVGASRGAAEGRAERLAHHDG